MAKWIRWWGLGVFAVIVLLWWLCIDFIVKTVIETAGTTIVGAKVELSGASLQLVPTSLTLTGLQVTDPDAPMTNLIIASKVNATLDSFQLFGRKVIADDMTVSGLQFNTERKTSGAIDKKEGNEKKGFDSEGLDFGSAIPGLSLPNVDELVEKEKNKLKAEYAKMNEELKQLEKQWDQRINELPDKDKIADYKQRIKKIKFLQQLSGLKSIKKDIEKDLDNIKNLDKQLDQDLKKVKADIARATRLPVDHANKVLAELGLGDNALDGLATGIMSGQIKQGLQQALAFIKPSDDKSDVASEEKTAHMRGEGIWVHFTQEQTLPEVLVRQASLDGIFNVTGQSINFQGKAFNLTHQPDQWHKPATFTLSGSADNNASIQANGTFDHRTTDSKDSIEFKAENLALENYALSEKPEMNVMAKKALANVKGKLELVGEVIDLDIDTQFNDVDLNVKSTKQSTTTTVLMNTLKGVKNFDLTLQLKGPLQKPSIKVKSDLDNLLANAVGAGIKQEAQALKGKLSSQLQAQVGPDIQSLNQQGDFLASIKEQLKAKQSELKKLTKGF